jgi:hypothetical protein
LDEQPVGLVAERAQHRMRAPNERPWPKANAIQARHEPTVLTGLSATVMAR